MRRFSATVLLLVCASGARAAPPFVHELFDQVCRTHVDSVGRVDYGGLKAASSTLDAYVDSLAACSPHSHPDRFPTPDHELAYWINAYNAFVLQGVVAAYPVGSVKEIMILNGFFRRMAVRAGGQELTLDQLENEIIRPGYRDPRIHFALNCGAASCPALEGRAFTGADLQARLELAAHRFAGDPQHVRLDRAGGELHLSKILEWYGADFSNWYPEERVPSSDEPALLDYLRLYLPEADAAYLRQHPDLEVSFNAYDWALNEQPRDR